MVSMLSRKRVKLVTFDALHTIITPRLPVHVQYSITFAPFLGQLHPDNVKKSFKSALFDLQNERPNYAQGHERWWSEVIKRTAIGAGAHHKDVDAALPQMVHRLLHRFSSSEAYRLFDDVLPTLNRLHHLGIKSGLISNSDTRILSALQDLKALSKLDPVLISEQEQLEKPQAEFFLRACARAHVLPEETLHVGDELHSDYFGASRVGMHALLLRRPGPDGEQEHKEEDEKLEEMEVKTIATLSEVVKWVVDVNSTSS